MHLQAIIHTRTSSTLWRGGQLCRLNCWGGDRICNWLLQRRLACFLRVVVNGKCIFYFRPHMFLCRVLSSRVGTNENCAPSFEKKNLQFRALDNSSPGVKDSEETCANNKNIHLQAEKHTHTHIHLLYLEEVCGFCCVCETSRSSSSSRVPSVDSFAVLKNQVSEKTILFVFSDNVQWYIYFKLYFFSEE